MKFLLWFLLIIANASVSMAQTVEEFTHPYQTPFNKTFSPTLSLPDGTELFISGNNASTTHVTLVIRIDDVNSANYASRVNEERVIPPGKFIVRIPLSGLKTLNKRVLDTQKIKRLMLFVGDGQENLSLDELKVVKGLSFSENVLAWDLGTMHSPLFSGFTRITSNNPALYGKAMQTVWRSGGDALLSDGVKNISRIRLPLPKGTWTVWIWTRDLGEWEFLPHPLKSAIYVNGNVVHQTEFSPSSWMKDVYLQGQDKELLPDMDAWQLFAERRGGLIAFDVTSDQGWVDISFEGDNADARFVSAILAWPAGEHHVGRDVQQARKQRFLENWRSDHHRYVERKVDRLTVDMPEPLKLVRGSAGSTMIKITSPISDMHPNIVVEPPLLLDSALPIEVRYGQWIYERPNASATLLQASNDFLRSELNAITLHKDIPRDLHIRVYANNKALPGVYTGYLQLLSQHEFKRLPFQVEVLPVRLPAVDRPIGIYLEHQPQLSWFSEFNHNKNQYFLCDISFLKRQGINGLAPPLTTPTANQTQEFITELLSIQANGLQNPLLAYTPIKRLEPSMTQEELAQHLARVMKQAEAQGVVPPVWSIADEPKQDHLQNIINLSKALHIAMPNGKLAAHLNNPHQKSLLPYIDFALINDGFGAHQNNIDLLRHNKITPWLYNLGNERIAAGFFLWRIDAEGYLQWHGRMPTADPFDPTDGRESDSQLIFPSKEACPNVMNVHKKLFDLADGILDLRWMLWLEQAAKRSELARAHLNEIKKAIPTTWQEAQLLDSAWAQQMRDKIIAVAHRLQ